MQECTERQEAFIKEFSKVLSYNENEILPSYDLRRTELEGAVIIREPLRVVGEGRCNAFCQVIGRLFLLSRQSPTEYALTYTKMKKSVLLQQYMLLKELTQQQDIASLMFVLLFDQVVTEAIRKQQFYYVATSCMGEAALNATMKRDFEECDASFFNVFNAIDGDWCSRVDVSRNNVIILSDATSPDYMYFTGGKGLPSKYIVCDKLKLFLKT